MALQGFLDWGRSLFGDGFVSTVQTRVASLFGKSQKPKMGRGQRRKRHFARLRGRDLGWPAPAPSGAGLQPYEKEKEKETELPQNEEVQPTEIEFPTGFNTHSLFSKMEEQSRLQQMQFELGKLREEVADLRRRSSEQERNKREEGLRGKFWLQDSPSSSHRRGKERSLAERRPERHNRARTGDRRSMERDSESESEEAGMEVDEFEQNSEEEEEGKDEENNQRKNNNESEEEDESESDESEKEWVEGAKRKRTREVGQTDEHSDQDFQFFVFPLGDGHDESSSDDYEDYADEDEDEEEDEESDDGEGAPSEGHEGDEKHKEDHGNQVADRSAEEDSDSDDEKESPEEDGDNDDVIVVDDDNNQEKRIPPILESGILPQYEDKVLDASSEARLLEKEKQLVAEEDSDSDDEQDSDSDLRAQDAIIGSDAADKEEPKETQPSEGDGEVHDIPDHTAHDIEWAKVNGSKREKHRWDGNTTNGSKAKHNVLWTEQWPDEADASENGDANRLKKRKMSEVNSGMADIPAKDRPISKKGYKKLRKSVSEGEDGDMVMISEEADDEKESEGDSTSQSGPHDNDGQDVGRMKERLIAARDMLRKGDWARSPGFTPWVNPRSLQEKDSVAGILFAGLEKKFQNARDQDSFREDSFEQSFDFGDNGSPHKPSTHPPTQL